MGRALRRPLPRVLENAARSGRGLSTWMPPTKGAPREENSSRAHCRHCSVVRTFGNLDVGFGRSTGCCSNIATPDGTAGATVLRNDGIEARRGRWHRGCDAGGGSNGNGSNDGRRGRDRRNNAALKPAMLATGAANLAAVHANGAVRHDISGAAGGADEQHCFHINISRHRLATLLSKNAVDGAVCPPATWLIGFARSGSLCHLICRCKA